MQTLNLSFKTSDPIKPFKIINPNCNDYMYFKDYQTYSVIKVTEVIQ